MTKENPMPAESQPLARVKITTGYINVTQFDSGRVEFIVEEFDGRRSTTHLTVQQLGALYEQLSEWLIPVAP